MSALIKRISNKLAWLPDDFMRMLKLYNTHGNIGKVSGITISVATFMDRYDHCFRPLILRLVSLFPDNEIIVAINGHFRVTEHLKYLDKAEGFCSRFNHLKVISYMEPAGLSSLWNRIIKESTEERILIMNDDVRLRPDFRRFLTGSGILNSRIATINNSWSYFIISKGMTEVAGFFDEGLAEIGGEDDDYIARMAMLGLSPENYNTGTLKKASLKGRHADKINSYGKVSALQEGGYSTLNTKYLENKWEISDEYFPGAVEVKGRKHRYWKLRS